MGAVLRHLRLPRAERARTREALRELLRAFVLVRILGWARCARTLGPARPGEPALTWDGDRAETLAVGRAVDRWLRIAPHAATCLVRALAGQRMLTRRGIPSALVLGLRTTSAGGELGAHGWLRVGETVVIGAHERAGHHPIAHFLSDTALGQV
jgi:hypothetical protein